MVNKQKVIITGAAGQDGLILSKILLKKKFKVYGIIKKKKYKNLNKKVNYFQVDIKNKKKISNYIKKIKPSIIVHFAANNPSYIDKINKDKFYYDNFYFSKTLIESSIKNNLKIKFIFANSSQIFHQKNKIVNEKNKFLVSNKYNKFRIDILNVMKKYENNKYFSFINLILFNHDSKYRNQKFLFPRLIKAIKFKNISFINSIYKENIVADFSHAEDICWAIYLIIKKQISVKNIILSSGKKTRVNLLIKFLINKYNLGIKIKIKQKKNNIYLIGNNKLAKKLLKWKPKKTIYDAVKEIYKAI